MYSPLRLMLKLDFSGFLKNSFMSITGGAATGVPFFVSWSPLHEASRSVPATMAASPDLRLVKWVIKVSVSAAKVGSWCDPVTRDTRTVGRPDEQRVPSLPEPIHPHLVVSLHGIQLRIYLAERAIPLLIG